MTALDLEVFFDDPWWLVLLKALFALVFLLVLTLFTIWYERRVVGLHAAPQGPDHERPVRAAAVTGRRHEADVQGGLHSDDADKFVFMLAPFVMAIPAVTAFAVIPIAGEVRIPFTDITTPLQVTDLPVSVLFIVAHRLRSACTASCWPAGPSRLHVRAARVRCGPAPR